MGSVVSFWKSTMRCIHSISAVVDEVSLARASRSARRSRSASSARWAAVIPLPFLVASASTGADRRLPADRTCRSTTACPVVPGARFAVAASTCAVRPARVLLVAPVGGDPVLGPTVHLVGADLDFDGLAVEADHRGVQRLVEVELGRVDVVLEPALHRWPDGVDRPQGGPAVLLRLDDDPDADQVVEVVELLAPDHHLLVDAPQVLRSAGDLGVRFPRRPGVHAPTPSPGPGTRRAAGPGWPPSARSPRTAWGGGWRRTGPPAASGPPGCPAGGPAGRRCPGSPGPCGAASTRASRPGCACCGAGRPA